MKHVFVAVLALIALASQEAFAASAPSVTSITVDKAARRLTLWHHRTEIRSYRIALGGNPVGHKQQEGDSRTPEGRYTIDARNPNSSFYLSLHISYPNRADTASARRRGVSPGSAIMIHGSPGSLSTVNALGFYPDWTAGCIAVSNSDIGEIFRAVRLGTPILIRP